MASPGSRARLGSCFGKTSQHCLKKKAASTVANFLREKNKEIGRNVVKRAPVARGTRGSKAGGDKITSREPSTKSVLSTLRARRQTIDSRR